jgi:hypothetical protein
LKQTFAVRFNRRTRRTGYVWGDRYWSKVLEGEPPEWAVEVDWEAVEVAAETGVISFGTCPPDGVGPLTGETPAEGGFRLKPPPALRLRPAKLPNPAHIRAESPIHLPLQGRQATATGEACPPPKSKRRIMHTALGSDFLHGALFPG